MKVAIALVITIVISIFCAIVILFLVSAIKTVEPYFRKWLERKLDRIFVPKHCSCCRYCAENWKVYPLRYHCNANDREVLADSSCDKWEAR